MIKINKILICVYLSFYMQHYQAQSNAENSPQDEQQHQLLIEEQELDDFFNEAPDFLNSISLHKKVSRKKTRYGKLQDKCRDYGVLFLIYYLHFKEQWHALYVQFKKKLQKVRSSLFFYVW
jgi:hypothetical protein